MKVIIRNWEKLNARKDVNNPTWFKFKHKFFTDSDFFGFSHGEVVVWLYLLCEASSQNKGGVITVNSEHAHRVADICDDLLKSALKKLQQIQVIELKTSRGRYAGVTSACSRQDKIREEKNRKENTLSPDLIKIPASPSARCKFDFESLYRKYPRKEGKQKGLRICQTQIKTESDFGSLSKAIDRYIEHCVKTACDPKFIKHFSTFMNSWRDWNESDTGSVMIEKSNGLADCRFTKEELDGMIIMPPGSYDEFGNLR